MISGHLLDSHSNFYSVECSQTTRYCPWDMIAVLSAKVNGGIAQA